MHLIREASLDCEIERDYLFFVTAKTTLSLKEPLPRPMAAHVGSTLVRRLLVFAFVLTFGVSEVLASTTSYTYDDAGRLVTASFANGDTIIYSYDAAGNRKVVQVTTDTTPPTVPAGLAGTAISPTQVNLTWSASTDNVGVTGYRVFRNAVSIGTSTTPSFSDTGLASYTLYTYTVAAYDAASNQSAQSGGVSVRTLDNIPPSAPGVPTFTSVTSHSATANWTAATDNAGVTSYDVSFNGGAWVSAGNVLSYPLSGLAAVTSYTFAVRAHDAAGNIGPASSSSFTTTWITDNSTIVQGSNVIDFGFVAGTVGSMSPTTTSTGYTYTALYDWHLKATGLYTRTYFSVSGFASDPTQSWLIGVDCGFLNPANGSNASTYSFVSGVATWSWTNGPDFSGSGTFACVIKHK